ncbi:hypothetical protein K8I28_15720 [bacterium]|nr:hypothetical protein [bacterium]
MKRVKFLDVGTTLSFVLLIIAGVSIAQPPDDDESGEQGPRAQMVSELELEKSISERLEAVLQPIVGPTVVLADLELSTTPYKLEGFRHSQRFSLPGLPVSESETVQPLGDDFIEISKVSIRVFVRQDMPNRDIDRITEIIPLWVNLDFGRGDQILVEPVPFVNPPMSLVQFLLNWKTIAIVGGVLFVVIVLLGVIISALSSKKSKTEIVGSSAGSGISGPISSESISQMLSAQEADRKESRRAESEAGAGGGAGGGGNGSGSSGGMANQLTMPDGALAVRLVRESSTRKALGPLSTLQEMGFDRMKTLISGEDAVTKGLALQIANPLVVSDYLESVPSEQRAEIFRAWDEIRSMTNDQIKAISDILRVKLEKFSGLVAVLPSVQEKMIDVVNGSSNQIARQIFTELESVNPKMARDIRPSVFFIEDIEQLDMRTLRRVVLGMPREHLVKLIKDSPENIQELLYTSLSGRMANIIREESAMVGTVSPAESAEAKKSFIAAIRQLEA